MTSASSGAPSFLRSRFVEDFMAKRRWFAKFEAFSALSYSRCKSGQPKSSQKSTLHKQGNYVKLGAIMQTLIFMVFSECL